MEAPFCASGEKELGAVAAHRHDAFKRKPRCKGQRHPEDEGIKKNPQRRDVPKRPASQSCSLPCPTNATMRENRPTVSI